MTGPQRDRSAAEGHVSDGLSREAGRSRVPLPPGVAGPYEVYVNGVRQELGSDFRVVAGELVFERALVTRRLGAWAWFLGIWGIGTYGRDEVDVRYELDGQPVVAHGLKVHDPQEPHRR